MTPSHFFGAVFFWIEIYGVQVPENIEDFMEAEIGWNDNGTYIAIRRWELPRVPKPRIAEDLGIFEKESCVKRYFAWKIQQNDSMTTEGQEWPETYAF